MVSVMIIGQHLADEAGATCIVVELFEYLKLKELRSSKVLQ